MTAARCLAAIMAIDVAGYSRLMSEEDGAAVRAPSRLRDGLAFDIMMSPS